MDMIKTAKKIITRKPINNLSLLIIKVNFKNAMVIKMKPEIILKTVKCPQCNNIIELKGSPDRKSVV